MRIFLLYSAAPPPQDLERNEKDRWGINCRMRPISLGGQDVGHSGVATGQDVALLT